MKEQYALARFGDGNALPETRVTVEALSDLDEVAFSECTPGTGLQVPFELNGTVHV
jgi:hypothetical protein